MLLHPHSEDIELLHNLLKKCVLTRWTRNDDFKRIWTWLLRLLLFCSWWKPCAWTSSCCTLWDASSTVQRHSLTSYVTTHKRVAPMDYTWLKASNIQHRIQFCRYSLPGGICIYMPCWCLLVHMNQQKPLNTILKL